MALQDHDRLGQPREERVLALDHPQLGCMPFSVNHPGWYPGSPSASPRRQRSHRLILQFLDRPQVLGEYVRQQLVPSAQPEDRPVGLAEQIVQPVQVGPLELVPALAKPADHDRPRRVRGHKLGRDLRAPPHQTGPPGEPLKAQLMPEEHLRPGEVVLLRDGHRDVENHGSPFPSLRLVRSAHTLPPRSARVNRSPGYFPTQNLAKISEMISSRLVAPTISPRASRAERRSSARYSSVAPCAALA